jgi:excinuclease UvrABC nuclease subunit
MPFQNKTVYHFNAVSIDTVYEVGGVYGLAVAQLWNPGYYTILYVGKSGNLRERLKYHLNNPPVAGITHFFAERIDTEAGRAQREAQLIAEFKPVGNTLLK